MSEMQSISESNEGRTLVLLATGGTIAGRAASPTDNTGYTAGALGVDELVSAVPGLQQQLKRLGAARLACVQLANIDSKDMGNALWFDLAQRIEAERARAEVVGVVITHGTDTLEETAYFLHRVLPKGKPVVLTAAMRPATSLQADGPQNLLDACTVALSPGVQGVLVAVASQVWAGCELRKAHTFELKAFDGGDDGPLARLEDGQLRRLRAWPGQAQAPGLNRPVLDDTPLGMAGLSDPRVKPWPSVAVLTSHAGFEAAWVQAWLGQGEQPACVQGLVVAGTGNCTLHHSLERVLEQAQAQGVQVLRTSRVARGGVREKPNERFPSAGTLTPAQARVRLMLELMQSTPA
jgi:L-asparaginase